MILRLLRDQLLYPTNQKSNTTHVFLDNRVKTNIRPRYFRQVLKLIHRPSTSMSSFSSQSDSERAISQYFCSYHIHVCDRE